MQNRLGTWLLIVCFVAPSIRASAQSTLAEATTPASKATSDEVFQTISRLDKQVFDAIDRCDMKTESSFWADDAEFYHDKNGLIVGAPQIVDAIKNNLCGKVKLSWCPERSKFIRWQDMVPLRSEFTASFTLGSRIMASWGRQSLFMSGATKMVCGRSQE